MANGIPDDVTFTPPAHDMSDVTFTPPSQAQSTSAPAAEPPPQRGVMENVLGGVTEGAAKFVTGAGNMLATGAEKLTGSPAGSLHATFQDNREAPSVARDAGEGVENIAEFSSGLEGLEGFAKAAKITELAKRIPLAKETLEMIKAHPFLEKVAVGAGKGATVGGAQGAVKGSAEGKTKEGLEGGALGGGFGGGTGVVIESAVTPLAEAVAQKAGIGTSATKDAVMGARPGKRNYRFAEDFLRAAPHMDDVEAQFAHMGDPAKTVEDWADRAAAARQVLYKQKIDPLVQANATQPLGGLNIANGIRAQIPNAMKQFSPDQAAIMERMANDFLPGQKFQLQMKDVEDALQHFNAELSKTGYWSKMPQEREALLKTDGTIAGYKAVADSLRDEFYGRLNQLAPGSDVAELKKDYGALRNIENEIRGRVNVNDRQAPISLKETIGLITGLGTGGPGGAAIAALPFVDRMVNSPERMLGRAVQKAARPGEEGIAAKTVQGAGRLAKKANQTLAAPTGSGLGRIIFTSSDGGTHSIPDNPNALAHAKSIDPGLKIVQ